MKAEQDTIMHNDQHIHRKTTRSRPILPMISQRSRTGSALLETVLALVVLTVVMVILAQQSALLRSHYQALVESNRRFNRILETVQPFSECPDSSQLSSIEVTTPPPYLWATWEGVTVPLPCLPRSSW